MTHTLLLVTKSPHDRQGKEALTTATTLLDNGERVLVFFYGDGAYTANRLMWQILAICGLLLLKDMGLICLFVSAPP